MGRPVRASILGAPVKGKERSLSTEERENVLPMSRRGGRGLIG